MQLRYRGVEYDPNVQTVEVTDAEVMGLYRGTAWHRCQTLNQLPGPQFVEPLQYRGVSYTTGNLRQPVALGAAESPQLAFDSLSMTAPAEPSSLVVTRQPTSSRGTTTATLQQVHYTAMQQSLVRRLNIAQRNGNATLIQLLEQEAQQLN